MKLIAYYLPQFHEIKENNEWWGKGFTEWVNVKKSKPLFEGHYQPRIPLNNNYYNLLDDDVKIWQANLAKKYGIYGFCYYHYWYNGHMLLEKPMEQMLVNKKIDLPFCISWCNQPWTKAWVGNEKKVLIDQKYGDQSEWVEHYNYLSKFFKDERYIFKDDKPLLHIYRPEVIPNIKKILECWNDLAIKDGLKGVTFVCNLNDKRVLSDSHLCFDYIIDAQPTIYFIEFYYNSLQSHNKISKKILKILKFNYEKIFGHSLDNTKFYNFIKSIFVKQKHSTSPRIVLDYKDACRDILTISPATNKSIPNLLIGWDNTPRYDERGSVLKNQSVECFKEYFEKMLYKTKKDFKQDMMFVTAWNEWAEGSILEPDEKFKYGFLEAIKDVLIKEGEFPKY